MSLWKTAESYGASHGAPGIGPQAGIAVLTIAAAAFAVVLLTPAPLLLPALSLVSFAIAACFALAAWWLRVRRTTQRVNLWDLAGACAFIGFAAGMISQPEHVVQWIEHATTR